MYEFTLLDGGGGEVQAKRPLRGGQLPLPRGLNGIPEYTTKIGENFHKTCYAPISIFKVCVFESIQILVADLTRRKMHSNVKKTKK